MWVRCLILSRTLGSFCRIFCFFTLKLPLLLISIISWCLVEASSLTSSSWDPDDISWKWDTVLNEGGSFWVPFLEGFIASTPSKSLTSTTRKKEPPEKIPLGGSNPGSQDSTSSPLPSPTPFVSANDLAPTPIVLLSYQFIWRCNTFWGR